MKIINVVGARPNFVKIAPIIEEMKNYPKQIHQILVHTGQHYDDAMSRTFFVDLEIPQPDIYLGVGSGSHAEQTAKIMIEFEKVCLSEMPDLVLVVGDVNSTLACSIVAAKLCIPVAHMEAGLRSFDRTMPEEINRVVTDSLSDYLFTTDEDDNKNLKKEGIPEDKIHLVGNVMIDTLLKYQGKAETSQVLKEIGLASDNRGLIADYAVVTLHRPSNVDDMETFRGILDALKSISERITVLFPVHPRTKKQIDTFDFHNYFQTSVIDKGIHCSEPLRYLDFLHLMSNAKLVLTDSGGIQEETTILGIPCLTLRQNTERPVTVSQGTNIVVGTERDRIIGEALRILNGTVKKGKAPPLWDGKAAQRIVRVLLQHT